MLPYPRGLILEKTPDYGIMKTETVFGFGPQQAVGYGNFNMTDPLQWIFTNGSLEKRSLAVSENQPPKSASKTTAKKPKQKAANNASTKENKHGKNKKIKRKSKKINKCIIKFEKGGEGGEEYSGKKRKRRRGGGKFEGMKKKYMMPLILGLLAAKSILIPIAFKFLAFVSAKGLMMGFFSTVLASLISLKGMFHSHHESSKRNDDAKTQVEIIQVPSKSEDQHIYYDEHYKRGDYVPVPVFPTNDILVYDNYNNVLQKKSFRAQKNDIPRYENKLKKINSNSQPPSPSQVQKGLSTY